MPQTSVTRKICIIKFSKRRKVIKIIEFIDGYCDLQHLEETWLPQHSLKAESGYTGMVGQLTLMSLRICITDQKNR